MFILKKIISHFLYPVPLSLWISLIGLFLLWFTQKQKTGKVFVSIGLFLILLLSNSFVSSQLLKPLESKYETYNMQISNEGLPSMNVNPIKFIVVLGGAHVFDPKLPITSQINKRQLVRLIEGIRHYWKHTNSKLILSGGGGMFDSVPNAKIMANMAKELGVEEKDIIMESKPRDTKDEAKFIKLIVNNNRFILVTSASHMPRSIAMFEKLGMSPIAAPTEHQIRGKQYLNDTSFFPSSANLYQSRSAFHEYLGIVWAKLRGQI